MPIDWPEGFRLLSLLSNAVYFFERGFGTYSRRSESRPTKILKENQKRKITIAVSHPIMILFALAEKFIASNIIIHRLYSDNL